MFCRQLRYSSGPATGFWFVVWTISLQVVVEATTTLSRVPCLGLTRISVWIVGDDQRCLFGDVSSDSFAEEEQSAFLLTCCSFCRVSLRAGSNCCSWRSSIWARAENSSNVSIAFGAPNFLCHFGRSAW